MSLQPGARLGPYEVLSALGAGGMGEVWRARDTRLDRDVALKVLPAAFLSDPERLARFEREAKVLASLNHPHIGGIYGLEEAGAGARALVLELVEGPTLAERIAHGPVPLDEALPIARQIAEALEAAHEQGIIHRDLKPANIKVRADGTVKVLDFGLAKALEPQLAAASADLSHSPTLTLSGAATRMGVILGTAAYMAPEQARGRTVDKRADIWAFGCVLYEMLSGRRAFEGESAPDLLVSVLSSEPPWTALPADVPARVVRVLRRCLEKDPRRRLRDAGDAVADLDAAADEPAEIGRERDHPARRSSSRGRLWWLLRAAGAGLVVGLMAAIWVLRESESAAPQPVTRTVVPLEEGTHLATPEFSPFGLGRVALALSPDGRNLAYAAVRDGKTHLYLRPMDAFESRLLPGTEGAFDPFFSPDSHWIAFFTPTQLMKISIRGGTPQTLCEATNPAGASWSRDGRILFAGGEGTELLAVSANGGAPEVLLRATWGEGSFQQPQLLPDGESILVTIWRPSSVSAAVVALGSREQRVVLERAGGARFIPTRHLVYTGEGAVMAVRFDPETSTVSGAAAPVLSDVRREDWIPQLTFSADGWLAYLPGDDMSVTRPVWVDRMGGAEESIPMPPRRYGTFRLSPDRSRLAIQVNSTASDVSIFDLRRGEAAIKLTAAGSSMSPIWRPDGRRITFFSERPGTSGIYEQAVGADAELMLATTDTRRFSWPGSWSAQGHLAFEASGRDTESDVWILTDHGSEPTVFIRTPAAEWGPAFSPDGRFIAYTSDESGQYEIYVKRYPATEERWQISSGSGEEPVWSAAGNELFFRRGREWLSASIRMAPDFEAQPPRVVFNGNYTNVPGLSYDVTPDGMRFLVLKPPQQEPPTQIHVVANWFEELRTLVP
jgi:serine/threonine protein kinase/Tol biopolymer transport system component